MLAEESKENISMEPTDDKEVANNMMDELEAMFKTEKTRSIFK